MIVRALALLAMVAGLAFAYVQRQPSFPSDITEFLPVGDESSQAAKELAGSGLSQRVVILVAGSQDDRRQVARHMAEDLSASGLFGLVSSGPPDNMTAIHEMYFPHRYDFVSPTQEGLDALDTEAGMRQRASAFVSALSGRYSMYLQRSGPQDPLLAYVGILERLSSLMRPTMQVVDGHYETASHEAALFADLKVSPFDADAASKIDATIHDSFERHKLGNTTIMVSGIHRYTKAISTTIRRDIQRITMVSLVGVLLIFGVVFGKLRFTLLPILSISAGAGAAFFVTSIILGEIHLIALAFGASLIGVCVDYAIHYLNHPLDSKESVWRSILMGAGTTIAGFSVLLTATVPALNQIAVFSSVGVAVSVATTWLLTRRYFHAENSQRHTRSVAMMSTMFEFLRVNPKWSVLIATPALGFSLFGLPSLQIEKDMRSLRDPLPALRLEDEKVQSKIAGQSDSSVVIIRADNAQAALELNDTLAIALDRAVDAKELGGYLSMHDLLWSKKTQSMNREFFKSRGDSIRSKMSAAYAEAGISSEALQPIKDGKFAAPSNYLTMGDIKGSALRPLGDLFDARGDGTVLLTFLDRVENPDALKSRLDAVPGAFWFKQRETLEAAWQQLGNEIVRAAILGLILIAFITVWGFRSVRPVLVALVPPVVGSFATLGVFGLLGVHVGPIHGLGLMLVIALAADYGVMLAARSMGTTALSIVMAYISTLFSFGALALSDHPLLKSFGMTIAIGATLAVCVLPLSDILLNAGKDTR